MQENRRFEYRILADIVVDDMGLDAHVLRVAQGAIRELSASGCRLESNADLAVGQHLRLSFGLHEHIRLSEVKAKVVRRLSQRSRRAVGVTFLDLSEDDQYKIREWIVWREAQPHQQEEQA